MQQILDAENDATIWRNVLALLPEQNDIYFQPGYVAIHAGGDTRGRLFVFRQDEKIWANPFVIQPVRRVGDWVLSEEWVDIESPYGYSGPISNTDDYEFLSAAHAAFATWCRKNNVVAEFVRLHPLLQNQRWLDRQVEVVYDRVTVSLDLKQINSAAADRLPISKTSLYMVRRAERSGLEVQSASGEDAFLKFVSLYLNAMDRLGADNYYQFSETYFQGLRQLLETSGWLWAAVRDAAWSTAAVFLKGSRWAHYHLSASTPDRRDPGATNLLIAKAALVARDGGLERLHLGGGVTSDPKDPLLLFKQSMATDTHSFYIGKRIHDQDMYSKLKSAWERANPSLVERWGNRLLCYRLRMNTE